MKKIVLSIGLGLVLATQVFASDSVLDQLNEQIASIFAPFQNPETVARLNFNAIETDDEHATKVGLNALYHKVGSQSSFEIKIDNLSYDYGDGNAPTTIIKGGIGVDLTKQIPQSQLNALIPMAGLMLEQIAKDLTNEATWVRTVITSTTQNDNGDYTGLTALIALKTDLTKLPEDEIKNNILLETVISLTIDVKAGWKVDAFVITNPAYHGFDKDDEGLKELLDKLLARDQETMDQIKEMITEIDLGATEIVEKNNPIKNPIQSLLNTYVKKLV